MAGRGREMLAFFVACLTALNADPDTFLASLDEHWPPAKPRGRPPRSRRIALVGCGRATLGRRAPARELYTSSLFRLSAEYAERCFDGWYIVSAVHGLVEPDTVLDPNDVSLDELGKAERDGWVSRVAQEVAFAERGAHLTVLGGGRHRALASYLASRYTGPLGGNVAGVDEPLAGLGMGERLGWLKRQLAADGGER